MSPAAEQRPSNIYAMYGSPIAGLIASGLVYAMMLSLVALALYGGWRAVWPAVRTSRQAISVFAVARSSPRFRAAPPLTPCSPSHIDHEGSRKGP